MASTEDDDLGELGFSPTPPSSKALYPDSPDTETVSPDTPIPPPASAPEPEPEPAAPVEPPAMAEPASTPAPPEPSPEPSAAAPAPPEPETPTHVATLAAPDKEPERSATPAPADTTGVVVVDVEPSPGAVKFLGTVTNAANQLSTLESSDVSDGMLELSKRCSSSMHESFSSFKEHALDLAIVASAEAPPAEGRWRGIAKQAEPAKLAQLPLAALYAVCALLCAMAFAVVYYPRMYGPLLVEKAKSKFIEYHVAEKAGQAKVAVVTYAGQAYSAAASSNAAAEAKKYAAVGSSKASSAYASVVASPAVQAISAKSGEAAAQVRGKVVEQLVKLRGPAASSIEATPREVV